MIRQYGRGIGRSHGRTASAIAAERSSAKNSGGTSMSVTTTFAITVLSAQTMQMMRKTEKSRTDIEGRYRRVCRRLKCGIEGGWTLPSPCGEGWGVRCTLRLTPLTQTLSPQGEGLRA